MGRKLVMVLMIIGLLTVTPIPTSAGLSDLQTFGFLPWWIEDPAIPPSLDYVALFSIHPTPSGWRNQFEENEMPTPHIPPGVKVMWTVRLMEDDYSDWIKDPDVARRWVKNLKPLIEGSEGVVFDLEMWQLWKYADNFTHAFKQAYPNMMLTVAVPDFRLPISKQMREDADLFKLMAYDYDPDEGILAPTSSVVESITENYWDLRDKLVLGIPLYGYVKIKNRWVYVPSSEIEAHCKQRTFEDGEIHCRVYGTITTEEDNTVSLNGAPAVYEDAHCIRLKMDLARKFHLPGVAFWALGYYRINGILRPDLPPTCTANCYRWLPKAR